MNGQQGRLESLPIDACRQDLAAALRGHWSAVILAPPGSGKTTRIAPWLITDFPQFQSQRVYLLQPRRVAAKSAAQRIATEQGWTLGREVGYQVRFENRVTRDTRLVVATEGVLIRRLQSDPVLADTAAVVLDEFHERSLDGDLLLAMLRRIQTLVRPDLKVVVMSATMATEELRTYLDRAPLVETSGQSFPVDVRYRPPRHVADFWGHLVETVVAASEQAEGDVLVFLPGVGEIMRTMAQLKLRRELDGWQILPLHGSMPLEQQSAAVQPGTTRRVVLATNIAETSLTLPGVTCVVDSGLARVMRYDVGSGMERLELEPICQASAVQRAGRAGRVRPGTCWRLWEASQMAGRRAYLEPEVHRVDPSRGVLQWLAWGESIDEALPWLDPPREQAVEQSRRLLERLGAVIDGKLTSLGAELVRLPLSPRLGRLVLAGRQWGHAFEIAVTAALLSERDPFIRPQHQTGQRGVGKRDLFTNQEYRWNCDVTAKVNALCEFYQTGKQQFGFGDIHRQAAFQIKEVAEELVGLVNTAVTEDDQNIDETGAAIQVPRGSSRQAQVSIEEAIRRALLAAFPDRLARRRGLQDARGVMVGGRGVKLASTSGVWNAELFLCVDVNAEDQDAVVRMASGIEAEWLPAELTTCRDELFFSPSQKQVVARRRRRWDDLLLGETPIEIVDRDECARVLFEQASRNLSAVYPTTSEALTNWLARVQWLREQVPELELPTLDQAMQLEVLQSLCVGRKSFAELSQAPWLEWMQGLLTTSQLAAVEQHAPERLTVPSGSRIRLEYEPGKPPVLAVRIQEVFSWPATPRIAMGRVPVLLHLLAPNMRPQQITNDLASFWDNTYEVVRKELKRRYPKHAWPEDPRTAAPIKKG